MRGHDVAIACAGAGAAEGYDRYSLKLDQDAFLTDVASAATQARHTTNGPASGSRAVPPLVVAALAPGSITAGWAANTQGAILAFLPGQEAGRAFADVLLGDVNPSGRLPVTIPYREDQVSYLSPLCYCCAVFA